jgi:hypothetical protein
VDEKNRYFNSRDKPIILSQTEGTARFKLHKSEDSCPLKDKSLTDPLIPMTGALFLTDFEIGNPP